MNVNETDSWGQEQRLEYLLDVLMNENPEDGSWLQKRYGNSFALFRGLVNLRPPKDCSDTFIAIQDAYLQEITREKYLSRLNFFISTGNTNMVGSSTKLMMLKMPAAPSSPTMYLK